MATAVNIKSMRVNDIPLLDNEETRSLFMKFKLENDESSKDKLICSNIRLVLNILQKYKNRGEDLDDLFQIGCIGLMKAVERFELSRDLKFSTYAVWTIDGEIKRYLRDNSLIRIKRSSKNLLYKINKAKDKLVLEYGHEPSNEQIANELGIKEKEISSVYLSLQPVSSLSEPVDSDNEKMLLMDKIGDSKISESSTVNKIAVREAIKKLKDKEREVINMRYFLDKTQAEIAEEFGVSQVHVSRLEKNAIKKMQIFLQ